MADIFRTIKNQNYTVMSNHHLQNPRLSLKAMGLLSKILSLPEDWNYSIKGLATVCKDGYQSVSTALSELEAEGYLIRRQLRDERGRISNTEYIFRETPEMEIPEHDKLENKKIEKEEGTPETRINTGISPESENPILDEKMQNPDDTLEVFESKEKKPGSVPPKSAYPESGFPITGFPITENRHQQNTNKINTNKINTISSSSNSEKENEDKAIAKIRKQIDYESLYSEFDEKMVNEVVILMAEILTKSRGQPVTINQKRVDRQELCQRFERLGKVHIRSVLLGMQSGPPIRNIRSYLLAALYQADITAKVNAQRKKATDSNKFNSSNQRDYDWNQLEKQLLSQ